MPSRELRIWFGHDPTKWEQFCKRYWTELRKKQDLIELLKQKSGEGTVTLVCAALDERHNSAVALKAFLEGQDG